MIKLKPEQLNKNLKVGPKQFYLKFLCKLILTCSHVWNHCSNDHCPMSLVSAERFHLLIFSKILRLSHLNSPCFFLSTPVNLHASTLILIHFRSQGWDLWSCPWSILHICPWNHLFLFSVSVSVSLSLCLSHLFLPPSLCFWLSLCMGRLCVCLSQSWCLPVLHLWLCAQLGGGLSVCFLSFFMPLYLFFSFSIFLCLFLSFFFFFSLSLSLSLCVCASLSLSLCLLLCLHISLSVSSSFPFSLSLQLWYYHCSLFLSLCPCLYLSFSNLYLSISSYS